MTDKEKALKIVANLIKDIDKNALALDVLKERMFSIGEGETGYARVILFNIIEKHGYELSKDYKLIPKK